MTNTIDYRKAYSEVDTFIELLNDENKKKIPKELIDFFKKEKDTNNTNSFDCHTYANFPWRRNNHWI